MSNKPCLYAGIEQEGRSGARHRSVAVVELITTVALAFSTAVAVTAVSIGMARAEVLGSGGEVGSFALPLASFIGLVLLATGGLMSGLGALRAEAPRPD